MRTYCIVTGSPKSRSNSSTDSSSRPQRTWKRLWPRLSANHCSSCLKSRERKRLVVKIVSIGEILWDVFPDAERLGGAPFNFTVNAHRLGHEVRFISAVGQDDRGLRALNRVTRLGLSVAFVRA